jgi:hypothetical protein
MAIVMVNGGGNTPQGGVTDGTSNTLMVGESLTRIQLVPVVGDWDGDGRDFIGNPEENVGSGYVLTSISHAAIDTTNGAVQTGAWIADVTYDEPSSASPFGESITFTATVDTSGLYSPMENDYSGSHALYQDVVIV